MIYTAADRISGTTDTDDDGHLGPGRCFPWRDRIFLEHS